MNLQPLKCKICNKIIKMPDDVLIIGVSETQRQALIAQALIHHLQTEANRESQRNGLSANPAHAAAFHNAGANAGSLAGYLMLECFELTPELQAEQDATRERIHAWSRRKLRITDEDLAGLYYPARNLVPRSQEAEAAFEAICDLRDRYEEIGKYAPANANAPAAPNAPVQEEVKK